MTALVKVRCHVEIEAGGVRHTLGSEIRQEHTVTGTNIHAKTHDVAAAATVTPFSVTAGDLTGFTFLMLETSADVRVELVTDDDNSVGEELFTFTLVPGVPFMLGSDDSYANYAESFSGGTLDKLETVRVKNEGASAATVSVLAVD